MNGNSWWFIVVVALFGSFVLLMDESGKREQQRYEEDTRKYQQAHFKECNGCDSTCRFCKHSFKYLDVIGWYCGEKKKKTKPDDVGCFDFEREVK